VRACLGLLVAALAVNLAGGPSDIQPPSASRDGEWRAYGRDPGGARFSPLTQLTPANVGQLQRAWTYRIGEMDRLPNISPDREPPAFQATPLVVGGVMYVVTPSSRLIALDAEAGTKRWEFDPQADVPTRGFHQLRGAAYWEGPSAGGAPPRRVLYGTLLGELVCLDADTGGLCPDFGTRGRVDLRAGEADRWPSALYAMTSPPAIFRDLAIVGIRVQESPAEGPPGVVRAFDVRSGRLAWEFRGIPRPGEPGSETWNGDAWRGRSGVNVWTVMSVDVERGTVFLPFGSPAYDFYGGDRPGQNLFGNALVALDAQTGRRLWHYQMVHHDIWDYDLPAQPVLATIQHERRARDVVVQVTKMGLVFVLDRERGTPIFPVEDRPAPAGGAPGEAPWPTQPFPTLPPPLVRHTITRDDLSQVTPEAATFCRELFDSVQGGRIYTPIGTVRTLVVPGNLGGANWSGAAFDPTERRLFVNVNELPLVASLGGEQGRMPRINHYRRFVDENGWPCVQPPWGALVAVDLDEGRIAWKSALGKVEQLEAAGLPRTGLPSLGGAIATAGGLIFVAGTTDRRIRAFDSRTGKELWEAELDASGHAIPVTSLAEHSGRQFVVIAAGGGGYISPDHVSDALIAFALREGSSSKTP
jgi:glucose dehydrogenase